MPVSEVVLRVRLYRSVYPCVTADTLCADAHCCVRELRRWCLVAGPVVACRERDYRAPRCTGRAVPLFFAFRLIFDAQELEAGGTQRA